MCSGPAGGWPGPPWPVLLLQPPLLTLWMNGEPGDVMRQEPVLGEASVGDVEGLHTNAGNDSDLIRNTEARRSATCLFVGAMSYLTRSDQM